MHRTTQSTVGDKPVIMDVLLRWMVVCLVLSISTFAGDVDGSDGHVMGDEPDVAVMSASQIAPSNVSGNDGEFSVPAASTDADDLTSCPKGVLCDSLPADCITCVFNTQCIYGKTTNATCWAKDQTSCSGNENFTRELQCRYCYQTEPWEQQCTISTECRAVAAPPQRYKANCTVNATVLCMGRRKFYKMFQCNWTSGYRWSTALALSITLGGFGVDRFYLGLWREGIGKLFSFGGLGVWTLVDVILIGTGYVGPADGSLYIF